jgi:hypothetical protein
MRMDKVALAKINSFASQAMQADFEPPSEEAVFILTACQLQTIISQAIQPMKDEITALRQKVARLEEMEEIYHGPGPQAEDIPLLRECWIKRREIMNDLPSRVWGLEEDLATLEQRPSTPAPIASAPKGEKTIARIAKIEEVLKSRGPSTLKELERILGIDKATMTRLLARLDMRRYELHSRPGDDREKVLRLKVQIR